MILLISYKDDPHLIKVASILKDRNIEYQIIDFEQYPSELDVTINFEGESFFRISGKILPFNSFKSVYARRFKNPKFDHSEFSEQLIDSSTIEFQKIINSLHLLMTNSYWLPNQLNSKLAEDKILQLIEAKKIGLNVPKTLISNSEIEVGNFAVNNQIIAFKAVRKGFYVDKDGKEVSLFTQKLRGEELIDNLEAVRYSPVIYQNYIEKAFELRITIVGTQFFACKIDSQNTDDEATKIDFRHYKINKSDYSVYELPEDIKVKLLEFMKALNLNFGCIDMIVTPEGEYVFLEINPNGQWLWIENNTGLKISEAIAHSLIKGGVN